MPVSVPASKEEFYGDLRRSLKTGRVTKSWTFASGRPAKNDAWVNGIIERQQRVYIGSPETKANLWDPVNNSSTVFGRELQQFFDAGYARSGDYLLPRADGWCS